MRFNFEGGVCGVVCGWAGALLLLGIPMARYWYSYTGDEMMISDFISGRRWYRYFVRNCIIFAAGTFRTRRS